MKPYVNLNGPWELSGYSDAYHKGDSDSSKSVTGYIVLINIVVIEWHLQVKKKVTLSVTEAEYSEIAEVYCETLFVYVTLFLMEVIVLLCTLITLELYSYWRTYCHPSRQIK